ncbi:hypothetical protein [Pseudomonas mosselii]|nr:hypothetical protein [Pseudomonas mosselii]
MPALRLRKATCRVTQLSVRYPYLTPLVTDAPQLVFLASSQTTHP